MFDENSSSAMLRLIDRFVETSVAVYQSKGRDFPEHLNVHRPVMITLHFACCVFVTVSALLETRWQRASRHVAEEETLQKQNNPGL